MPGYISLGKYTQQGLATIKQSPERLKQNKAAMEKMGIRLVGIWWTLGEYDMVAVWDAPDDQSIATILFAMGQTGFSTGQTMRALSEEEFAQVVRKLP